MRYISVLFSLAFLFIGCGGGNQFMIENTEQYKSVTDHLNDSWKVVQLQKDGTEQLNNIFSKATLVFDFKTLKATITAALTPSQIEKRKGTKFSDVQVTSYTVIGSGPWSVYEDGRDVALSFMDIKLDVQGSGNIVGLVAAENAELALVKSSEKAGGSDGSMLSGFLSTVASSAANSMTGFDQIMMPTIGRAKIILSSDNKKVTLKYSQGEMQLQK